MTTGRSSIMSPHCRRQGSLLLPTQLLLGLMLLLLLIGPQGVKAMENNKGEVRRQDFNTNFGGPPLGDHGFVGENPLPRPQGVVDLGNFGDNLAPSDVFQQVDNTFNIHNQLTHVTAKSVLTCDSSTPSPITTSTSSLPTSPSPPATTTAHRRQRAPFQPHLPLQSNNPFRRLHPRPSNSIPTQLPKRLLSSFSSIVTENSTNITLESGTFELTVPRTEVSKDISSFSTNSAVNENRFADADDGIENTAFKVFNGPETEVPADAGSNNLSSPEDVLTVNFEEHREAFPHPGVRGNHRPGHLGRPARRPSRPSRRPIRQSFKGRPRNKPRRDRPTPSLLSLLAG